MKEKLYMKFVPLLLFFTYVFSSDEEKVYSFITKYEPGEIIEVKSDMMLSFEAMGRETVQGQQQITISKFIGEKDGNLLIEEIITDIVAIKKTLDKTSPDHDMNQMADIPYVLHIDRSGKLVEVSTEYKQYEEELRVLKQSMNHKNYLYPFGEEAVNVSKGDTWTSKPDTISIYIGDGDMPNNMIIESEYTLKKIKMKKGHEIATISAKHKMNLSLKYLMAGKLFEGSANGTFKRKVYFDFDMGKIIIDKANATLQYELIIDDKDISTQMVITSEERMIK